MNIVKYRQVGAPSSRVVRVRVSQSKRAIYPQSTADGKGYHKPQAASLARANKTMLRKGFVRAGVRHG